MEVALKIVFQRRTMMKIFSKILLVIYSIVFAFISAIVVAITVDKDLLTDIYKFLKDTVLTNGSYKFVMFCIGFFLFVLSLFFIVIIFKKRKEKKSVNKVTDIGEISISLMSLENIALSATKKLDGMSGTKAVVSRQDKNVAITIRTHVYPDINIPSLSEKIQSIVKTAVEDISGITVNSVRVFVESITESEINKAKAD